MSSSPVLPSPTQVVPQVVRVCADEWKQALTTGCLPGSVYEGLVSSVIEQVYRSREAFIQTSQNALTTAILFYTAAATQLAFLVTVDHEPRFAQVVGAALLISLLTGVPFFRRAAWRSKVDAGYDLYIAACVHAVTVFHALGLPLSHLWLRHVVTCGSIKGYIDKKPKVPWGRPKNQALDEIYEFTIGNPSTSTSQAVSPENLDSIEKIIAVWKGRGPNLHYYYKILFSSTVAWIFIVSLIASGALIILDIFDLAFPPKK
jgi:hypothetical protein